MKIRKQEKFSELQLLDAIHLLGGNKFIFVGSIFACRMLMEITRHWDYDMEIIHHVTNNMPASSWKLIGLYGECYSDGVTS